MNFNKLAVFINKTMGWFWIDIEFILPRVPSTEMERL